MSNLGLGGLVSGINTDDILYKLMQIENSRIDLEKTKKAGLAAKQDAWKKVKSSLETLRLKLDGVRYANSLRTRKATFTDDTVASATVSSGATMATHKLSVTQLAQAEVVGGKLETSATAALSYSGSIVINGKTITVSATDSLNTLRDNINATADVNVKAEVVKVTTGGTTDQYRLTLTAKSTGLAGAMTLADVGGAKLLNNMGFDTTNGGSVVKNTLTAAQDATFTLDNQAYQTASNTITDAIPGVTLTLKKATATTGAQTDITIGQDTTAAENAAQAWVDALNSSIDLLKTMTAYNTGTKEKAVLNGDGLARNILNSLRSTLSAEVAGLPSGSKSLADVGIATGAWGTENYGKIVLDKTKFSAKLVADEDAVTRIFGGLRLENNLALSSTGTTAAASSTQTPGVTDPALAINGDTGDTGWVSANVPASGAPETMTLTLPTAQSVDQIRLYIPNGADVPTAGLKDFKLYYQNSTGAWTELESVTGFTGTSRTFAFDPVVTSQIKLEVSATYGAAEPAKVSELQVHETNRGIAVQMYRFVNGTLATGTGPVATRDSTYTDQIKSLDDKISKMYIKMADQQDRLKLQFDRMEQALAKLQAQGNQLMGMLGTYSNQK